MANDPGRAAASFHPTSLLRPCVLLLLEEYPGYGYQLPQRLYELVGTSWDHGTIYRLLNTMEAEGLVVSSWERSATGPQRRRYALTSAGHDLLVAWAETLGEVRSALDRFFDRYHRRRQTASAPAGTGNGRADARPGAERLTDRVPTG